MRADEYTQLDGTGIAALVAKGEVTRSEVLDAALAVLADRQALNTVVTPAEDQARAADARGPFAGVPTLIKDLGCDVAGLPTKNGSRLFADAAPADHDSTVVARLRAAGTAILGKSGTPEFGFGTSTEPGLTGAVHNPWNPAHSTGGSSGGSAAAVAAGIVPFAHATDGGGSIRIPAACCGLFGLKPSRGRVSLGPDTADAWAGLSGAHVVTRSLRDSAAFLDILGAPAPGEPYAAPAPRRPYRDEVGADPGRLRIGLLVDAPDPAVEVDPACRRAAADAAARLASFGHRIEQLSWPANLVRPGEIVAAVSGPHTARTVDKRLAELGRDLRDDDLDGATAIVVAHARKITLPQYLDGIERMHATGRLIARFMDGIDVLLTPAMAVTPPPLGRLDPNGDAAATLQGMRGMAAFTSLFNVTGQPAAAVPFGGRTPEGLPMSVQLAAAYGDEAVLFRLAGQLLDGDVLPAAPAAR
ncbi:amidase [Uniformispora flossi]|uniref:amidase n=1 Tax=Uniformispora flossi TaxID=3390723 RepID=UPI003C2DF272